jgi:hypothetical protein
VQYSTGSEDILQVQHFGELYPDKIVYCIPGAKDAKEIGFLALLYHIILPFLNYLHENYSPFLTVDDPFPLKILTPRMVL